MKDDFKMYIVLISSMSFSYYKTKKLQTVKQNERATRASVFIITFLKLDTIITSKFEEIRVYHEYLFQNDFALISKNVTNKSKDDECDEATR